MQTAHKQGQHERTGDGQRNGAQSNRPGEFHFVWSEQYHDRRAHAAAEGDHGAAREIDAAGNDDDGRAQGKDAQVGSLPDNVNGAGDALVPGLRSAGEECLELIPVNVAVVKDSRQHHDHQNRQEKSPFGAPKRPR